jgi:hypothetical protein
MSSKGQYEPPIERRGVKTGCCGFILTPILTVCGIVCCFFVIAIVILAVSIEGIKKKRKAFILI